MITWAEVVLLILRIAQAVMNQINSQTLIAAGKAEEIVEVSSAIAARVAEAKAIQEQVGGMSDVQVDDGLKGLEP